MVSVNHTITNGTAHGQKPCKESLASHFYLSFGFKEIFIVNVILYFYAMTVLKNELIS